MSDHPHRKTRAQERADEIDVSPTRLLAQIEELTAARDEAATKADEYLEALQRERAEFQNFRRRTNEERERDLGLAAEDLLRKLLALADDFDLAIAGRPAALADDPWAGGIGAIDRKLRTLLESEGVMAIEASHGRTFDPREHEAISSVEAPDVPEGTVVGELRRGYRLRDRVIRPALVAVSTGGPAASAADGPTTTEPTPGDTPPASHRKTN